jgi:ABC-2 type transport system ATP-binding protein
MRRVITTMRPDKVIVISTHLLEEVEAVCNRAIIIAHGRILADGTPAQLAERSRHHNAVRLRLVGGVNPNNRAELAALAGVAAVEPVSDAEGDDILVFPCEGRSIVAEIADLARERGWAITGLRVERGRLDDVFREITTAEPEPTAIPSAA